MYIGSRACNIRISKSEVGMAESSAAIWSRVGKQQIVVCNYDELFQRYAAHGVSRHQN